MILTFGTEAAFAAKNATTTIPIVLGTMGDPVGTGLVASLSHPGGNITGCSIVGPDLTAKRAELLHEMLPSVQRVAVVVDTNNRISASLRKQADDAFRSLGVQPIFIEVNLEDRFANVPAEAVRQGAQALDMDLGPPASVLESALSYHLPVFTGDGDSLNEGAVMAFGVSSEDMGRRLAAIIDKILRGATPGDIPIEQPTRFVLGINLKSAKALGITVPESLLLRADEVIR